MPRITNNQLNKVAKRKRVVLSIEKKLQIIERVLNGEAFTKLGKEYGVAPQTCRDIFNTRDKLVSFAFCSGTVGACLKRKTLKRPSFFNIDKAVYQWFLQQRSEGLPITGPMLIEKALWFHKEMKISEPFSASSGWLSKFKARYNIRQPKTKDDKLISDEPLIDKFKTEFKKIVQQNNFTFDQIYLADEKVLFWNCLGSVIKISEDGLLTISETNSDDGKGDVEFLTVMACANANGSKKLKLFCTGRYKEIENLDENESKCVDYYRVVKGKNLYEKALKEWFHSIFIPEVKIDLKEKSLSEKALLVVKIDDNVNTEDDYDEDEEHVQVKSDDDNFTIIFLPRIISELPQMSLSSKDILTQYIKTKLIPTIEDCHYKQNVIPLSETFSVLSEAWKSIKNESMQHSSWWWNNLFTEMENESIIEPRESIIPHFMSSLIKMKPIDDSLPAINSKRTEIGVRTDLEGSEDNLYETEIVRTTLDNSLAVNNLKTGVKVEEEDNICEAGFNDKILSNNVSGNYVTFKTCEEDERNFEMKTLNNKLPVNDNTCQVEVKKEVDFDMQCLDNYSPTFPYARIEIKQENETFIDETSNELDANFNFQNYSSDFQEKNLGNEKSSVNDDCHEASSSRSVVVTADDAIKCTDKLLLYLKQQSDCSYSDFLVIGKIRQKLKNKIRDEISND